MQRASIRSVVAADRHTPLAPAAGLRAALDEAVGLATWRAFETIGRASAQGKAS